MSLLCRIQSNLDKSSKHKGRPFKKQSDGMECHRQTFMNINVILIYLD